MICNLNFLPKKLIIFAFLIILFLSKFAYSYDAETNPVHQYISQQAQHLWPDIPSEITNYLQTDIFDKWRLDKDGYNIGEDIIVGSAEEDMEDIYFCEWAWGYIVGTLIDKPFFDHFWDPDIINSQNVLYNAGWTVPFAYRVGIKAGCPTFPLPENYQFGSNYRRALSLWNKASKLYLSGDKQQAYYWIGRISHLLADLTVPAHVHDDTHVPTDSDLYEKFTASSCDYYGEGNRFIAQHFKGDNYKGKYYKYENLPNLPESLFNEVYPSNPFNLFKLFWYTAQKTQYFASNDVNGNNKYFTVDGKELTFNPSLWNGESVSIINDSDGLSTGLQVSCSGETIDILNSNVDRALIPHAMKAVAGLYRLFWVETHLGYGPNVSDSVRQSFLTAFNAKGPSIIGVPLSQNPDVHRWGNGYIQDFDGGSGGKGVLMLRDGTDTAYWVHGDIWNKYESLGGATGFLGYPLNDESEGIHSYITGAKIRYNNFEGGFIEHHATGPRAGLTVWLGHGIVNKWKKMSAGSGSLGAPVSDERSAPASFAGTKGRVADFEGGRIYWHGSGPYKNLAFATHNKIDAVYTKEGGTGSWLGFPISDQYMAAGYLRSDFEGGYITTTNGAVYKAFPYAQQTGILSVTTVPINGDIYVDGEYKGTGSWSGSLSLGSHTISFGDVLEYITPVPQTITITAGQISPLTVTYTQSQLQTLTVLSLNPESGVSIVVSPNDSSGQSNGTTPLARAYNKNTPVTITAPATMNGNSFQKWQQDGTDLNSNQSITVAMDTDHTITAVYSQNCVYTLAAYVTPVGAGTILKNPDKPVYCPGEQVTISVIPSAGYAFGYWSGDLNGSIDFGALTMNSAKQIRANFITKSKGDINNDGRVNLQDAILSLQVISGLSPLGIRSDYVTSGADVDGDNQVGLPEALYILNAEAIYNAPPTVYILADNLPGPTSILLYGPDVYWTDSLCLSGSDVCSSTNLRGVVKKVGRDGGTPLTLTSDVPHSAGPTGIAIDDTSIYWAVTAGYGTGYIYKAPIEGGATTTLAFANQPYDIAVDANYVYWAENNGGSYGSNAIRKIPINGGEVIPLTTNGTLHGIMTTDENYVYFRYMNQQSSWKIAKVDKKGGGVIDLASINNIATGIAVDSNYVYWSAVIGEMGDISRVSINGGAVETLVSGLSDPERIAIDDNYIYFTEYANEKTGLGTIKKVSKDGGLISTIADGLNGPFGIAVDNDYIYWTERGPLDATPRNGSVKKVSKH